MGLILAVLSAILFFQGGGSIGETDRADLVMVTTAFAVGPLCIASTAACSLLSLRFGDGIVRASGLLLMLPIAHPGDSNRGQIAIPTHSKKNSK